MPFTGAGTTAHSGAPTTERVRRGAKEGWDTLLSHTRAKGARWRGPGCSLSPSTRPRRPADLPSAAVRGRRAARGPGPRPDAGGPYRGGPAPCHGPPRPAGPPSDATPGVPSGHGKPKGKLVKSAPRPRSGRKRGPSRTRLDAETVKRASTRGDGRGWERAVRDRRSSGGDSQGPPRPDFVSRPGPAGEDFFRSPRGTGLRRDTSHRSRHSPTRRRENARSTTTTGGPHPPPPNL